MGSKKKPKKSQAQIEAERRADMFNRQAKAFNRQAKASEEKGDEILRNAGEEKASYESASNEKAAMVRNRARGRSSLLSGR